MKNHRRHVICTAALLAALGASPALWAADV